MDPRFISLFSVFNITFPSDKSLKHIYESILLGHLQAFDESLSKVATKITQGTLDLYKVIVNDLPPTPSKFHYIFNLRDLSRVAQGLLQTTPDRFSTVSSFVRVWRNECIRVFYDRLINETDKAQVEVMLFILI